MDLFKYFNLKLYIDNYNNNTFEILENDSYEIEIMIKYCQCSKCILSWYNPIKYILSNTGCMLDKYPNIYVINKTIDYINKNVDINDLIV